MSLDESTGAPASTSGGESSTSGGMPTSGGTTAVETPTSSGGSTGGSTSGDSSTTSSGTSSDDTTGAPIGIEEALAGIDGLTWVEVESEIPGYRYFDMKLRTPADHDDPDGLQFDLHVMLLHRDAAAPMVIDTEGYDIDWYVDNQSIALSQPAALLQANELIVEHRFFADSRPEPADWGLLTIEQAAADHHHVTSKFKSAIYGGPWVATGISKGGMTAVYFRRFYPDDVVATVAYVAPLHLGLADPRYWPFVEAVHPPCTAAMLEVRRELLLRREAMVERIEAHALMQGYDFTQFDPEHALEITALQLPWSYYQYNWSLLCPADVPTAISTDLQLWDFMQAVRPIETLADEYVLPLEPYYWQAAVQVGNPAPGDEPLADLLKFPGFNSPASYIVPGPGKLPVFDPGAMQDIAAWVSDEATAMLFVYGEIDPWTAGAYPENPEHDVHRLVVPGGRHGADIAELSAVDRAFAYERLEAWTGVAPIAGAVPIRPAREQLGLP